MTTTTSNASRRDRIITAIGILVLLIGTATGNAYAILGLAVLATGLISILYRERLGRTLVVMGIAAAIAAATAMTIVSLAS